MGDPLHIGITPNISDLLNACFLLPVVFVNACPEIIKIPIVFPSFVGILWFTLVFFGCPPMIF